MVESVGTMEHLKKFLWSFDSEESTVYENWIYAEEWTDNFYTCLFHCHMNESCEFVAVPSGSRCLYGNFSVQESSIGNGKEVNTIFVMKLRGNCSFISRQYLNLKLR